MYLCKFIRVGQFEVSTGRKLRAVFGSFPHLRNQTLIHEAKLETQSQPHSVIFWFLPQSEREMFDLNAKEHLRK